MYLYAQFVLAYFLAQSSLFALGVLSSVCEKKALFSARDAWGVCLIYCETCDFDFLLCEGFLGKSTSHSGSLYICMYWGLLASY